MKLGPFEFRLRAAAQPTPRPPKERGTSGTINMEGFLQQTSEYLPGLRNPQAFDVWDRMRRSDASVREALQHIKAPLANANWQIEPASDEPDALEIAAFVRKAYLEWLSRPLSEHLSQALRFLDYGFQVFELAWQVVEDSLEYEGPDGEPVETPSRQFLTFKHFGERLPRTIYKWNVEAGELVSVIQNTWVSDEEGYQFIELPADDLLVYTHEREGDEFSGTSILRAAYKAWAMKEAVEKIQVVAAERHGVGTIVFYPSATGKNDDAYMDRAEQIAQNWRSGEYNYVISPDQKLLTAANADGCLWEIVGGEGSVPDMTALLEYYRGEIKGNVLARFSELGHGSVGARATGDVQSEVWKDAIHAVARQIEEVHQKAIKRLVDFNYPNVNCYPRLKAQDIESRNLAEFADMVFKLVSSQAVNTDQSFRAWVRSSVDAPDEDDPLEPDPGNPQQMQQQMEQEHQPGDPQPQPEAQQQQQEQPAQGD